MSSPAALPNTCRAAPFPKVIGKGRGETVVTHLDIFESPNLILAGGYSNEVGVASGLVESYKYPWVASFEIDRTASEPVIK
jgi:hypothetical protein